MNRSFLASCYIEDLFAKQNHTNVESAVIDDEEWNVLAPSKTVFYTSHGVLPPIVNIERRMLRVGFNLPRFLGPIEDFSDHDFHAYMLYWGLRLSIRINKESEVMMAEGKYDVDDALIEELVEAEMQNGLGLSRWWEPLLEGC